MKAKPEPLPPCPFCGKPPSSFSDRATSGVLGWLIVCPGPLEDCPVHPKIWRFTKAEAIEGWSRRAQ